MTGGRTYPYPSVPRQDDTGREVVSEPARADAGHRMLDVLAALHDSFVVDEDLDDDLEMVVGATSALLTMAEVEELTPRLCRTLRQLVNIAHQRADGAPMPELIDVDDRAQHLKAEPTTRDFEWARGHLRLLAFATPDVLELLAVEDADTHFPDFQGADSPIPSRWSA